MVMTDQVESDPKEEICSLLRVHLESTLTLLGVKSGSCTQNVDTTELQHDDSTKRVKVSQLSLDSICTVEELAVWMVLCSVDVSKGSRTRGR